MPILNSLTHYPKAIYYFQNAVKSLLEITFLVNTL